MWLALIGGDHPTIGCFSDLFHADIQVVITHAFTQGPIEALDEGILIEIDKAARVTLDKTLSAVSEYAVRKNPAESSNDQLSGNAL